MAHSPVVLSDGKDPEMDQAFAQARATFRYFWRELSWESRRIVPGLEMSAVKFAFEDPSVQGANVEHLWLGQIDCDGERIVATVLNQPNWIKNVAKGQVVTVPIAHLEDWIYVQAGRAYGAFTVNLLRSRMSAADRAAHDKAWGLDFGDPKKIKLVPDWDGPDTDPDQEHPMSMNMRDKLEEAVRAHPEMLTSANEHGVTMLHQLAMAGSADGVEVLVARGADPNARDSKGRTARDLAVMMGWPVVVATLT